MLGSMRMTRANYGYVLGTISVLITVAIWRPWDTARADWLRTAQQEVQAYGAPSPADFEAAARGEWATKKHLVFSNGWAAFKMHSIHSPGPVGDVAVLLTSDGDICCTFVHLCKGIPTWRGFSRPSSPLEYLESYGANEKWKKIGRAQPGGPANGSQPLREETNQPSSAAGSRR
jgi:hypothetical protein